MAWRFSDAPDQIGKETGADLATGDYSEANPEWVLADDVWSRDGGGALVLAEGDPYTAYEFELDTTYTFTAEVLTATDATVGWGMSLDIDGQQGVIGDVGVDIGETIPGGAWVTVTKEWRSPDEGVVTGSVALSVVASGAVQVRGASVAPQTGRVILTIPGDVLAENIMASGGLIAGTPDGARVEMAGDGLHAYDTDGTETAHIKGDGGEFVGGEFRTSDALPGQVAISDVAFTYGGTSGPGISVEPVNATGYTEFPGIGPRDGGLVVSGGQNANGYSGTLVSPAAVQSWGSASDGAYSQMYVTAARSSLERRDANNVRQAYVGVNNSSQVALSSFDGSVSRELYLDRNGIRIFTEKDGELVEYNLEETAQDSGWESFSATSGVTSSSCQRRNKGGVMWLAGTVRANWSADAWTNISTFGAAYRPTQDARVAAPVQGEPVHILEMTAGGVLRVYRPSGSSGALTINLSALSWPIG